jgi:hypothetical protein
METRINPSRRLIRQSITFVAVGVFGILVSGCSKGGDDSDPVPPPLSVDIAQPLDGVTVSGTTTLQLRVTHQVVTACTLELAYSVDGGVTRVALTEDTSVSSDGLGPLTAGPGGASRLFAWNTIADLGTGMTSGVTVYAVAIDADLVRSVETQVSVTVNNLSPPTVSVSTPSGTVRGDLAVMFTLFDVQSDVASVAVEVSSDGGTTYSAATLAAGAPEGTTGLATSPGGSTHTFLWDSRPMAASTSPPKTRSS